MTEPAPTKCPCCNGRGAIHCECWPCDCICGWGDETCEECAGTGWIYPDEMDWQDNYEVNDADHK